jgi:hypothetical protein
MKLARSSTFGPVRLFTGGLFFGRFARRARRYPPGAHAVAVGAARRLHCAARAGVAPPNSLRSLRSLRSDSRGESVDEARALRAPTPALRCSSPQKSPLPDTACRSSTAQTRLQQIPRCLGKGAGGQPAARLLRSREAQGSWPRAQRASCTDSSRLSERRERSERSEFGDGPRDRASQGTLAQRGQATKRRRLPARAFARADARAQSGHRRSLKGRKPHFAHATMFHASQVARSEMDH